MIRPQVQIDLPIIHPLYMLITPPRVAQFFPRLSLLLLMCCQCISPSFLSLSGGRTGRVAGRPRARARMDINMFPQRPPWNTDGRERACGVRVFMVR